LTIWLRAFSQCTPLLIATLANPHRRALYIRGSDYETSDAVFGVKDSLIVGLQTVTPEQAKQYNVDEGTQLLTYDFVLVTDEETKNLRHKEAEKAMQGLGLEGMTIINGLPVPDVD
jgi:hypothetical protein